ncbi:MAG: RNA polymerase sporulation sigma factor SigK [Firmicutes bacterium]|nr:RNA polymerase sporulation sigma factor SigK [Bacillota bacterium]
MFTVLATVALVLRGIMLLLSYITTDSFPQPLSQQEERYYLQMLERGNEYARHILIERNLRLVAHVVKKFENTGDDREDLISIGTIGLIKAINTFNVSKGARLATYAAKCVENEILMHIRARKKNKQEVSLHEAIGVDKDGNEVCWIDVLGSSPDEVMDRVEMVLLDEKLKRIIKKLNEREKKVLIMRYGLEGKKRYTQREVALELGISRSYVSRIEKKILYKISDEFHLDATR